MAELCREVLGIQDMDWTEFKKKKKLKKHHHFGRCGWEATLILYKVYSILTENPNNEAKHRG